MSKIIAAAAIRGGHKILERAEKKYQEALEKWGPNQEVGFPNTGYAICDAKAEADSMRHRKLLSRMNDFQAIFEPTLRP